MQRDEIAYGWDESMAAFARAEERAGFLRRTYLHLAGAVALFVVLETILLNLPGIENLVGWAFSGYNWLIFLGGFMFVSWIADAWAQRPNTSPGQQYAALSLYVAAEALIFVPLLYIATAYGGPEVIGTAALATLVLFGGLSIYVYVSGADLQWLRGVIVMGGIAALIAIVLSMVIGFTLGIVFTVLMLLLASASVLYNTSQMLHRYRTDQHVVAALALFASVALMFWYMVRLLMELQRD